jgi:hypothetical protein
MSKKLQSKAVLKRNTLGMLLLTFVLYAGYQISNRFHILEPRYLPLTIVDNSIPFLVWTVWPYFLLIFMAFLPIVIKDKALFERTMLAFTIGVSINIAFWLLIPTIFYRPPLPTDTDITSFAYRWLCSIDTPANCFPSGHITSPAIGCWAISKEFPKYRLKIGLCFLLLSITILTTKQHYIWDLPGGLCTAMIGIWLSGKIYSMFKLRKEQSIEIGNE